MRKLTANLSLLLSLALGVAAPRLASAQTASSVDQETAPQCNFSYQASQWWPIKTSWSGSTCLAPTIDIGYHDTTTTWLITVSLTAYSTTGGKVWVTLQTPVGNPWPWTMFFFNQVNVHQQITYSFVYTHPAWTFGTFFPKVWANGNFTLDGNDMIHITAVQI